MVQWTLLTILFNVRVKFILYFSLKYLLYCQLQLTHWMFDTLLFMKISKSEVRFESSCALTAAESTRWWSNDVVGWSLGFRDGMDCCWSVQLEIDFGLSVKRHCQCRADQQQPISTSRLWQLWLLKYPNQCFLKTSLSFSRDKEMSARDPVKSVKNTALLSPCGFIVWMNPDHSRTGGSGSPLSWTALYGLSELSLRCKCSFYYLLDIDCSQCRWQSQLNFQ